MRPTFEEILERPFIRNFRENKLKHHKIKLPVGTTTQEIMPTYKLLSCTWDMDYDRDNTVTSEKIIAEQ